MLKIHPTFSEQGKGLFICNGLSKLGIFLNANINNLINIFVYKN